MTHSTIHVGTIAFAAALCSCGLIDSDVTNFDLTLPDKQFTIDATAWQVDSTQANMLLGQSCASMPGVCATAAEQACADGCTGTCSSATQECELALEVSLYTPVDLLTEKPELKAIDDEPVIDVTIDSVTYDITSNTLNVDTPELTVYVAPMSVMDPADPQARAIGTIPPVTAGTTTTTSQSVVFTATGRAELVGIMSTFKTPFNVIVGSTFVVREGTPVPTGKLDAVVHIKGHAGL